MIAGRMTIRAGALVLVTVALATAPACAVLSRQNRVLTGFLDEHLAPESRPAQVALAPIAAPIGLISLSIDGAIIGPVRHVPESLDNAYIVFENVPFTGFGEIVVFPMRLITYPVIFLGSLIIYTTIP